MELQELEELLSIDPNDLDTALVEQPELFYRVSQEYVRMTSLRDEAYEHTKTIDAELDIQIREQFEAEGKKVTEKIIDSNVRANGSHSEAHKKYLELKNKADNLAALKESFQQRSYMLRELCNLYVSGYSVADSSFRSEDQKKKNDIAKKHVMMSESFKK